MKKTFLVTGQAEYCAYVEADSAEEAKSSAMNLPLADIKVVEPEGGG